MAARAPKSSPSRRVTQAAAYEMRATAYHEVRPEYPAELIAALEPFAQGKVADIGAGTGLFTQLLPASAIAVEPSAAMRETFAALHPERTITAGTAEATGLPEHSFDLVTLAQTWHWCDVPRACAEFDRILTPDGRVAIVWNQLDTTHPWVHRYTRISRSGDIYRPGDRPPIAAPFEFEWHEEFLWTAPMPARDLIALAQTKSFYLAADGTARERTLANLEWYLFLHLGFDPEQIIEVPYRSACWIARRPMPDGA